MVKATAQQCHAFISYFIKAVKEETGTELKPNRNKSRWQVEAMLMDYSVVEAKDLVDFYVKHYNDPSLEWFLYNYDRIDSTMKERAVEEERRKKRLAATEKKLEEWRNRWKSQQE